MTTRAWVIVGAGYSGAVIARRLAEHGERSLVVDRRPHIAGNAYDYFDAQGVQVHKYGPHIFHTSSKRVVDFLSRFTEWTPYEHRVLADVDGILVPVPFNLDSIRALFPAAEAARLSERLIATYGLEARVPILKLLDHTDETVRELAGFVFEKIFLGYTTKQWGLDPRELSSSVTARVPVAVSHDDRYFQDEFQNMPSLGYTAMFERILDHPNIEVATSTDLSDVDGGRPARLVYTGEIDEFLDYRFGPLPYRSLRFEFEHDHDREFRQPVAQVNFPNDHTYTRITEFKHLTGQHIAGTTVAFEYPEPHRPGENVAYYPVPMDANLEQFSKYKAVAEELAGRVFFVGRLATYRYINMDQAVLHALTFFDREIAPLLGS